MKYFFLMGTLFCASPTAQEPDDELARTAYFSGRYEEALVAIQQCIDRDTANYRYLFLKGRTLENLYRYDEAIAAQQKALLLNPAGMEARAALAALYLQSGQPAASAQFYEQLAVAEPQINRWKMGWATALQTSGNPKDALEQLKIVAQTDTANWLVYKNMGDCYFRIDSMFQTFHHYYMALQLYPQNRNLWSTLMRILVTNNQSEGAVEVGKEAVKLDATNAEVWKYLGVACYKLGNARQADTALGNALTLGDSTFTAMSHYGIINYHLNHYYEAEKYLEKALLLDSNDMNTMNYLASAYGFTGKPQKGLDILKKIDDVVAQFDTIGMKNNVQRGYLLRMMNRFDEAANAYMTAVKDFPDNIQNYYEVAICYDWAHNQKSAFDWYTRYLEKIDPDWANRKWTTQELTKYNIDGARNRLTRLKTDLFFEGEQVGN